MFLLTILCSYHIRIGRWDFDTQEEYSDYMSTKEALPKAAFQYGVKMQDGRKTRKNKTEKNEKAELDREWQKIQVIFSFIHSYEFNLPCSFVLSLTEYYS